ncbi:MAG TPA: hypothetical protein VGL86_18600 [Polyangia bacterium]
MIVLIAALVHVSAVGHCPEAATIEARLASLLPSRAATVNDNAVVSEIQEGIRVELRGSDGKTIGSRSLPAAGSCDDRAEAVAVTIASWESDVANDSGLAFVLSPPIVTMTKAAQHSWQLAWNVEVSFLASIAGGAFAAGATGEVMLGKRHFPLAAHIGVAGLDTRELQVGTGHASWNRIALTLGPTFEVLSKVVHLDLHADALVGWLFVQGQGYSSNHGDNAFDPALGGGARLSIARWDVTPWVDVTLLGWLRTQTASATEAGSVVSNQIPRFDVWLRAGVAYGRRK